MMTGRPHRRFAFLVRYWLHSLIFHLSVTFGLQVAHNLEFRSTDGREQKAPFVPSCCSSYFCVVRISVFLVHGSVNGFGDLNSKPQRFGIYRRVLSFVLTLASFEIDLAITVLTPVGCSTSISIILAQNSYTIVVSSFMYRTERQKNPIALPIPTVVGKPPESEAGASIH
jgi:hypothetical protein